MRTFEPHILPFATAAALCASSAFASSFTHTNGVFVTGSGNGQGGADTSLIESGFSTSGYSCSAAGGTRLADQFVVPAGELWTLSKLHWFAFQTGAPTSGSITGIQVNLWSSMPATGGTPLWTGPANVFVSQAWTNCYRVVSLPGDTSRAVMDVVANLASAPALPAGTYWIDVQVAGSLASGPWAVPTVPHGSGDDARFFSASTGWVAVSDIASGSTQDLPFQLEGDSVPACSVVTSYCTAGTTTNGCTPSLGASGTPSASASSGFTLACSAVEGQRLGIFFYGVTGSLVQPWAAGSTSFLCVKLPTQRTIAQASGGTLNACHGSSAMDFLAF
jgi:hypothetical protein